MCRSVSSYGAAGAAPIASMPSSSATLASSSLVTAALCRLRASRRWSLRAGARSLRSSPQQPFCPRPDRTAAPSARPSGLLRLERVTFGLQPSGVELLARLAAGGAHGAAPAGRCAFSPGAQIRFACAMNALWDSGGLRVVPPPQPASSASTEHWERRVEPRLDYTIGRHEGDRHPRGRRAGSPTLRGRPRPRAGRRRGARADAVRLAQPPRRLDAEGHALRAEAAHSRRGRLGLRRVTRRPTSRASSLDSRS